MASHSCLSRSFLFLNSWACCMAPVERSFVHSPSLLLMGRDSSPIGMRIQRNVACMSSVLPIVSCVKNLFKFERKTGEREERIEKTNHVRHHRLIPKTCQSLWCKVQVSHESRQSRPKSPAQKLQPLRRHHICTLGSIDK